MRFPQKKASDDRAGARCLASGRVYFPWSVVSCDEQRATYDGQKFLKPNTWPESDLTRLRPSHSIRNGCHIDSW